jgi:beta-phosphoglucomutase-like phosphatase (HAD superfamily)/GTP:adenosylcobinamide-phosphate guanylyltransferase
MNIIIPIGGKGERFSKCGYTEPKPLIKIFEKTMIEYVIDNLKITINDNIFIIYNHILDNSQFSSKITQKYPHIKLIKTNDTKGAVETLLNGLKYIINNYQYHKKCLIIDCDTFYTSNIIDVFRNSNDNMLFYTKNYDKNQIYSYIELNDEGYITNIQEKKKITDNANTGAYAFNDIDILYKYCRFIIDNNITFNNEPYTSCVIAQMIKSNDKFKGVELCQKNVISLGTPNDVNKYIQNTYVFLFDLDGTLVITDDIYFEVWSDILLKYNIVLTNEIFKKYIQGNNDKYVSKTLLINVDISLTTLSQMKDDLFIKNIDKLKVIDDVYSMMENIKGLGHKISIVTNCNSIVAKLICQNIKIDKYIDFIVASDDCINGKPHSEPYIKAIEKYNIDSNKCFIFEDSKTGILSAKGCNPKLLIGLESNYDKNELKNYGVNFSIKNYTQFNFDLLFNNDIDNIKKLKQLINYNSSITNIIDIKLDNNKLKGGFIADVISFDIITNDNNVHHQILKYENTDINDLSTMAKQLQLYNREYYFYKHIAHKITNIKIPKFYNLIKDNNKVIGVVLENLISKNYQLNLNLNEVSIDVSLKIVDRMAKLHSNFWNKNLKTLFPKLNYSTDEIFMPFIPNFINDRYLIFKDNWYKILNDNQKVECERIFENFSDIQKSFAIGNNLTFIHGDIKSPNIFYDTVNDNEPYFIDWQHCAIGKGVQDLIFFILESFDINNIKVIYNLIKNYYYKKLIEYGINNYSYEEYEKDIYNAICYIPFFTSVWFGSIPQDELIDKNFPFFLISKMFYLLEII